MYIVCFLPIPCSQTLAVAPTRGIVVKIMTVAPEGTLRGVCGALTIRPTPSRATSQGQASPKRLGWQCLVSLHPGDHWLISPWEFLYGISKAKTSPFLKLKPLHFFYNIEAAVVGVYSLRSGISNRNAFGTTAGKVKNGAGRCKTWSDLGRTVLVLIQRFYSTCCPCKTPALGIWPLATSNREERADKETRRPGCHPRLPLTSAQPFLCRASVFLVCKKWVYKGSKAPPFLTV